METSAVVPSAAPAVAASASTPVPASAPAAAPSSVASPSPATGALSHSQSVSAMVEAAKAKGFGDDLSVARPAETSVATPAAPASDPAKAEPAPGAEESPAAQYDEPAGYSLEQDGFVGPKELAAKIDANPALKAALDPNTRNEIMANARLAARTAGYEKFFASPAEAEIAVETAQTYAGFSEAFSQVGQDVEKGTTAFINKLIEGSALRDDNGEIVRDDKGFVVSDGTASKFLQTVGKRWLALNVVRKVEELAAKGDENVKAALDLVMESVGLLPSTADKTIDSDPAIAARKADLDAQEARIRQERETSTQTAQKQYKEALEGDLVSLYEAESGKLLGLATGLDDFTKTAVQREIDAEFKAAIKNNHAYQEKRRQIRQRTMSAARRAAELQLAKNFTRDNLARIATPILKRAGASVQGKAEARTAAAAARAENARSEVNGGAASQPAARNQGGTNLSPAQEYQQATESWKAAHPGMEPSSSDITTWMMLNAARAKGFAA